MSDTEENADDNMNSSSPPVESLWKEWSLPTKVPRALPPGPSQLNRSDHVHFGTQLPGHEASRAAKKVLISWQDYASFPPPREITSEIPKHTVEILRKLLPNDALHTETESRKMTPADTHARKRSLSTATNEPSDKKTIHGTHPKYFEEQKRSFRRCRMCEHKIKEHVCQTCLGVFPHVISAIDNLMEVRKQRLSQYPTHYNRATKANLEVSPEIWKKLPPLHGELLGPTTHQIYASLPHVKPLQLPQTVPPHQMDITLNPFLHGPPRQHVNLSPSGITPCLRYNHESVATDGNNTEIKENQKPKTKKCFRKPLTRPPVSKDPKCWEQAKALGCHVVLSLGTLLTLLCDLVADVETSRARVPTHVSRDGVLYLDKPLSRVACSARNKNRIFFRNAIRAEGLRQVDDSSGEFVYRVVQVGPVKLLVRQVVYFEYLLVKMEYHNKMYNQIPDDPTGFQFEILSLAERIRLHTVIPFYPQTHCVRVNAYTSSVLHVETFYCESNSDNIVRLPHNTGNMEDDVKRDLIEKSFASLAYVLEQTINYARKNGPGEYLLLKFEKEFSVWKECPPADSTAYQHIFPHREVGNTEKWDRHNIIRDQLPSYSWPTCLPNWTHHISEAINKDPKKPFSSLSPGSLDEDSDTSLLKGSVSTLPTVSTMFFSHDGSIVKPFLI